MTRRLVVAAGDKVLLGRPNVAMPGDWTCAAVIWTDGTEVVVEQHAPVGSRRHKRLCEVAEIRAVSRSGGWGRLQAFKGEAIRAVQEQVDQVEAFEARLGRARQEAWDKLGELGVDVPRQVDEERSS